MAQEKRKAAKRKEKKCTELEDLCCREYVRNGCKKSAALLKHNKAAAKWKKTTLASTAYRMFNRPHVKKRVKQLQARIAKRLNAGNDNVIRGFAQGAFYDIRDAFDDNGNLLPIKEMDTETAAAIDRVELVGYSGPKFELPADGNQEEGNTEERILFVKKVHFVNRHQNLESLAKHLGLFEADNKQKAAEQMSDDEIMEELKALRNDLEMQHDEVQ